MNLKTTKLYAIKEECKTFFDDNAAIAIYIVIDSRRFANGGRELRLRPVTWDAAGNLIPCGESVYANGTDVRELRAG